MIKRKSLGEILVELGDATREGINRALEHQQRQDALIENELGLHTRKRRRKRLAGLSLILLAYVSVTATVVRRYASAAPTSDTRAVVRGDWLFVNGDKFLVKAVGWDPARPTETPWQRTISTTLVDEDFRRIRAAGFNTIRTWEAMTWEELTAAERHGLKVLQGIWIEPDGDFGDAAFRFRAAKKIRDIVGYSRESRAVIGYLIMNEPEAAHVLSVGVETTRALLRELANECKKLDPQALVAFSNWPGVEFLSESSLDFGGANLHPFRPTVLLDALGYEGMVRVWKRLHGPDRPLIVTEYGVSVAPIRPTAESPGGASEDAQAQALVSMGEQMLAAGAAGGAAFSWLDGWWKGQNRASDEQSRDADDPEEWFGLNALDHASDRVGRARPAMAAMQAWHEAIVVSPTNGPVDARHVLVEIHSERHERLDVQAALNGQESVAVPLVRDGAWHRGFMGLGVDRKGAQTIDLSIFDAQGTKLRSARRVVFPPGEAPHLSLEVEGDGVRRLLRVRATNADGTPVPGASVRVALVEAQGKHNIVRTLQSDDHGEARLAIELPSAPAVALVAAGLWSKGIETPIAIDALLVSEKERPRWPGLSK